MFTTGLFGQNFEHLPFEFDGLMFLMLASFVMVPAEIVDYFVKANGSFE